MLSLEWSYRVPVHEGGEHFGDGIDVFGINLGMLMFGMFRGNEKELWFPKRYFKKRGERSAPSFGLVFLAVFFKNIPESILIAYLFKSITILLNFYYLKNNIATDKPLYR